MDGNICQAVAVDVRCRKCGKGAGLGFDGTIPDGTPHHLGSVYWGTIRRDDDLPIYARRHPSSGGQVSYAPLHEWYSAFLETPTAHLLPAQLPGWCDRHARLSVEREAVLAALVKWRTEKRSRPVAVRAWPSTSVAEGRYALSRQPVGRRRQAPEERP